MTDADKCQQFLDIIRNLSKALDISLCHEDPHGGFEVRLGWKKVHDEHLKDAFFYNRKGEEI